MFPRKAFANFRMIIPTHNKSDSLAPPPTTSRPKLWGKIESFE
jgi:hypothetical protein